jgi:hypothetical protein
MKALGQDNLLRRCQNLSESDIYGLFYMLLGAMTETPAWPIFYMVLNEILPTWEETAFTPKHTELKSDDVYKLWQSGEGMVKNPINKLGENKS